MPNRLSFNPISFVFFALGLCVQPSLAFAGFQWVSPSDTVVAPAPTLLPPSVQTWPAAPAAQAAATKAPEVLSPVIITGNSGVPSMAPTMAPSLSVVPSTMPSETISTSANVANVNVVPETVPVVGGKQPLAVAVLAPVSNSATVFSTSPATDIVHGFAKQVPLAVALRQILPAGYGFSVDPDVDLGVLISFQGGKPWRNTLRDALEPAGLVIREQGQMVAVGHAMVAASVSTPIIAPIPTPQMVAVPAGTLAPVVATDSKSVPAVEDWHAERGDKLHKVIESWAQRAGIELNWMAEYDYPLQASFSYTGTFEDALRNLLTGFQDAHPQPIAELHSNSSLGLKVLIVQTRGNSYSD